MGCQNQMLRAALSAVLVVALTACGSASGSDPGTGAASTITGDDTSDPTSPTDAPQPASYQVPAEYCPGWTALTVTTDDAAEIDYLDDMPACMNAAGDTTYVENRSTAVWVLRSTASAGTATPVDPSLTAQSFVAALAETYPGEAILAPGAKVSVNLPPAEVEWVIDLPLSFGWQAHETVVEKIQGAGQAAALAALRRQSPAGSALAVCTLAVNDYATTLPDLDEAEPTDVLVKGFGYGVAGLKCRNESAAVGTVDEAGRSLTLSDDIARLRGQTEVLEKVHGKLSWAQKAWKAIGLALKFIPR